MKIFKTKKALRLFLDNNKKEVALVPTMGALHEGHIALIKEAKKSERLVVVSIFLNPLQFFNNEDDYKNYPKNIKKDIKILENEKVDVLFNPSFADIYLEKGIKNPINFRPDIFVSPNIKFLSEIKASNRYEHFLGVLTIVNILFNTIKPDVAFFGEKDFIQLTLIKMMIRDFNSNVKIVSVKTKREKSGLAKSSRNQRLSKSGLELARKIYPFIKENGRKYSSNVLEKKLKGLGIKKINRLVFLDKKTFKVVLHSQLKNSKSIVILISVLIENIIITDSINI